MVWVTAMKDNIIKAIEAKAKCKKTRLLVFSYILSLMIAGIVYVTGGKSNVYANLMYLPIAIVAATSGRKQGVIIAVVNGLLIGYFMHFDKTFAISIDTANWILRMVIYSIMAFIIGTFSEHYRQEYEKNIYNKKLAAEAQMATIYSLVKLSESRDDSTGAHIERVAFFCKFLAEKMRYMEKYKNDIDEEYVQTIFEASPLHDIGKVGIPDYILLKSGQLTEEEFEIMKSHTTIGAKTLLEVHKKYPNDKVIEMGIEITNYHHEKWDGSGYPFGLSGEQIPLSARIMALADVYDALRSKRVYKEAYSHKESVEIIKQGRGTHFDPDIVDVFLAYEAEFEKAFDTLSSAEKNSTAAL